MSLKPGYPWWSCRLCGISPRAWFWDHQPVPGRIDFHFRPILPDDVESQLQELTIDEYGEDYCDKDNEKWDQLFYEMCNMDDELCEETEEEEEEEDG